MTSWRDPILEQFTPQAARLTIAADPDGLLLEEGVSTEIARRGFELLPFDDREDRMAFRFAYESRYRSRRDRGGHAALVVVLRAGVADLRHLPHDILQAGRRVPFTLTALFPHLSRAVLAALVPGDLDALYEAYTRAPPPRPLDDAGTVDFVRRHGFGIAKPRRTAAGRSIHPGPLTRLLTAVERSIPDRSARHQEWLAFARQWARVNALLFGSDGGAADQDTRSRYGGVRDRVDAAFTAWITERFGTLHNQPPLPPVMTHHVPRMLARTLEQSADAKAALVVVDGLALDQWATVRGVLAAQRPRLRFHEDGVFAWIPTLTMVSRQACFSGRPPLSFPASIHTTDREPSAWRRFWADEGLPAAAVGYEKNLRDDPDLARVAQLVRRPGMRAVGLVVDAVDRIMHGMMLGAAGMHGQVRQWTGRGFLAALLDLLIDGGCTIYLTSDHGNVETIGCGRPGEGSAADLRGERVRVFSDAGLRGQVKARFPDAVEWPPLGLPDDYLPLLAPARSSFVRASERPVAHGGITLEEVVVPLVRVEPT